ncbi:MAG: RNA-directed DNA polymerase [Verrucomicrobia bacterium]|nr:RNA-directed DNA polymerase [Verrucomicrobiota bacterium]
MNRPDLAAALVARRIVAGTIEPAAVTEALVETGGLRLRRARPLARQIVRQFGGVLRPRWRDVARLLAGNRMFRRQCRGSAAAGAAAPPTMRPAAGAPQQWPVPPLTTPGELAAWLRLSPEELLFLAARWRERLPSEPRVRHYHYAWHPRRHGPPRLLEVPKARLKWVQRRILRGILDHIPPHAAAHGFRRGCNILSYTSTHTGRACVLRMDVQDFFPSLRRGRIVRIFLTAGYPEPVATLLADLCTTATPAEVLRPLAAPISARAAQLRVALRSRHLPQGAPTSPALANLCAFGVDARLAGLARRFGATFTRYADDLLFSGDAGFARSARRCEVRVGAILLELGLTVAHRKTRVLPRSVCQRAAGLVLNERPGLPRRERDRLKAILTNCVRHGPASQNRANLPDFAAHLRGRVAHALATHPASAARLLALYERIVW